MTFIVKINVTEAVMFNINSEFYIDAYTIITANDSLIRYLMKLLDRDSISMNESGYVCIRRKDGKLTTLQRAIMEFYSEELHNSEAIKLDALLNHKKHANGNIDVDHINNCKIDNRLTNFQLLEHSQNVNKACGNEFMVAYSNEKIQALQTLNRKCSRNKTLKNVINRFNILNDTSKRVDEGLAYKLIKKDIVYVLKMMI